MAHRVDEHLDQCAWQEIHQSTLSSFLQVGGCYCHQDADTHYHFPIFRPDSPGWIFDLRETTESLPAILPRTCLTPIMYLTFHTADSQRSSRSSQFRACDTCRKLKIRVRPNIFARIDLLISQCRSVQHRTEHDLTSCDPCEECQRSRSRCTYADTQKKRGRRPKRLA